MAMALHSHSLLCKGRTARRLVPLFVFSTHRVFAHPRTIYFRTANPLLTTQVYGVSCRRLTAKAAANEVFSAPELSKNFDFTAEERIYNWWESQGYFKPNIDLDGPPFVISMPPPNVTGALHMGHAMFVTLEDIMTRYWRMKGRPTLWLPGTDHAGIATQLVVEKMLASEGIRREDLSRDDFIGKVWEWKKKYGRTITNQLKRLGASCDWSREHFTLDEQLSQAVVEAFIRLHEKGLIYRGEEHSWRRAQFLEWEPHNCSFSSKNQQRELLFALCL